MKLKMIKPTEKPLYVADAYGCTDRGLVRKVNELVEQVNELTRMVQKMSGAEMSGGDSE